MKDQKVWEKGDFFHPLNKPRIDMDPAVVDLPTAPVPVHWNFNHAGKPYGIAENFRLVEGEILCDVVPIATAIDEETLKLCRLGGYYTNVILTNAILRPRDNWVVSCELKGVSYMLKERAPGYGVGANPGAEVQSEVVAEVEAPSDS